MGNNQSRKRTKEGLAIAKKAEIVAYHKNPDLAPPAAFVHKDPNRTDILILGNESTSNVLLKKDHAGGKEVITTQWIHGGIRTNTLALPGYQLMFMSRENRFSRMRNIKAENWRKEAHDNADAFVYAVHIADKEEYLTSKGYRAGWEADRSEISRLLRKPSLMENPSKPFVLLVNEESLAEDFDTRRIVNLLGLGNLQRSFRAVSFSLDDSTDDKLKETLEWMTTTARSADEATAMTESETEEEGSITTTSSTIFSDAYVLDYEPTLLGGNQTLQRFEPIKQGTHCPFARAAKLWGGKAVDERMFVHQEAVEKAAFLNAGPLAEFVERSKEGGERLDGFCLEIPGSLYVKHHEDLGEKVCRILAQLAELDPSPDENAMKMGPIDQPHWRFRFAGEDFFITTFAPIYKEDSSRYAFGATRSFMLFQPMTSFGRHGLSEDTPASATNWSNPTSMRDKARVAFKENGCPYYIPEELPYPVAEHIVKPDKDDGTNCIRWWKHLKTKNDTKV